MAKNDTSKKNSLLNLASVIAIIIAIVVWILLIVNNYTKLDFISQFAGILAKIKDVCLAFVVLICALSYASGMKKGTMKTIIYVCCAVFLVLAIVGVVIL